MPVAFRPAQSSTLVWPLATVPAVVRSSRQAVFCIGAPGTSIRRWCAQGEVAAVAGGTARAPAPATARASSEAGSRERGRMLTEFPATAIVLNVAFAHKSPLPV